MKTIRAASPNANPQTNSLASSIAAISGWTCWGERFDGMTIAKKMLNNIAIPARMRTGSIRQPKIGRTMRNADILASSSMNGRSSSIHISIHCHRTNDCIWLNTL